MNPVESFISGVVQAALMWGLIFVAYYCIQRYRRLRRARYLPLPVPKARSVTPLSTGPHRVAEADRLVRDYELTVVQAHALSIAKNATAQGERRSQLERLVEEACERESAFRTAMLVELVRSGSTVER